MELKNEILNSLILILTVFGIRMVLEISEILNLFI